TDEPIAPTTSCRSTPAAFYRSLTFVRSFVVAFVTPALRVTSLCHDPRPRRSPRRMWIFDATAAAGSTAAAGRQACRRTDGRSRVRRAREGRPHARRSSGGSRRLSRHAVDEGSTSPSRWTPAHGRRRQADVEDDRDRALRPWIWVRVGSWCDRE